MLSSLCRSGMWSDEHIGVLQSHPLDLVFVHIVVLCDQLFCQRIQVDRPATDHAGALDGPAGDHHHGAPVERVAVLPMPLDVAMHLQAWDNLVAHYQSKTDCMYVIVRWLLQHFPTCSLEAIIRQGDVRDLALVIVTVDIVYNSISNF